MIVTENLVKQFDLLRAVDDVSLTVQPGEVLGFLGPNGAGKSTTMKMIAGFLAPTSGRASICGYDVVNEPRNARAALGYLPEGAPGYGEMTPSSFLRFIADVRGLRGPFRRQCLNHVVGQLHLGPVLYQPIATLSKGFRRRVGLAHALLHDPPVLILDEPTDGLDPNQKHEVRALINQIARSKTIIISTHILEEVAPVCTRAAIIAGGRLLVDETPAALLARSRYRNAVRVSLAGDTADAGRILRDLDGVKVVEAAADGNSWTIFGEDGLDTAERVRACCNQQGWTVLALRAEGGRLDDVFRELTLSADGEAA
ncbi:MAG: ATP-binding cassette domain-containing protein [Halofilum sp. (in: g-proteobacteria)]|nr:ATP-binding cassette domain-containing protein [Halofilum sp. (in: g-proteobacteria)]